MCSLIGVVDGVEKRIGTADWIMNEKFECDDQWEIVKQFSNEMHRMSINTISIAHGRNSITFPSQSLDNLIPDTPCFLGELSMKTWRALEAGGAWAVRYPPQFVQDVAKLPGSILMDIAYSGWPIFSILSIWSDVVGGAHSTRRPPTIEQIWSDQRFHPRNDEEQIPLRTAMAQAYLGEKNLEQVVQLIDATKNETSLEMFAALASWYRLWELLDAISLSTPWVHMHEWPRIWMRVMPYRDMMSDRIRTYKHFHCPSSVTQV